MKKLAMVLCVLALPIAGCAGLDGSGASDSSCEPGGLATKEPGVLTIAADKPPRPPYFEGGDPANGKGFESAVAHAIASRLGYPPEKVEWKVMPLDSADAGSFDFAVGQVSISAPREKSVDLSSPYYTANQAVVALKRNAWIEPDFLSSMARVKIGVEGGTSSLEAVEEWLRPRQKPSVFGSFQEAIQALKAERVEAVVAELPEALEVVKTQAPEAHVVAQFDSERGDRWGALLREGSPLTPCVSRAIQDLDSTYRLNVITTRWMSEAIGVLVMK